MKKILYFCLIFLICPCIVMGSVDTYDRTKKNLRVPDKIDYKDSMYNSVINTPSVNSEDKIYDFADILSDEDEEELYDIVFKYIDDTKMDLAIVTIDNNVKSSTREYADDFYDYNDFKIDGVCYVIDMENREFYISTAGKGLMYYDNDRVELILSSMDDSMFNHNYKESIDILVNRLTFYYNYGYSNSKYEIVDGKIVYKTPYVIFFGISFIFAFVVTLILSLRNKPVKLSRDSFSYLDKKSIKITNRNDSFIRTHTTSTYSPINHDSGSSGSSSGSFHSGSSGMSHGGGGHHF